MSHKVGVFFCKREGQFVALLPNGRGTYMEGRGNFRLWLGCVVEGGAWAADSDDTNEATYICPLHLCMNGG